MFSLRQAGDIEMAALKNSGPRYGDGGKATRALRDNAGRTARIEWRQKSVSERFHLCKGVRLTAPASRSASVVNAPSVTFLQKPGPANALNVVGSHSSSATTWVKPGEFPFPCALACVAPAKIAHPVIRLSIAIFFIPASSVLKRIIRYRRPCSGSLSRSPMDRG